MDLKKIMLEPEYDFLREHERLGKRIILMGLVGSYAYGTNNDNSDIDFRGITLQSTSDLLGMTTFEQYEDAHTDTVLYGFNKIVRLLLECNPNTIELLGLDENQYLIIGRCFYQSVQPNLSADMQVPNLEGCRMQLPEIPCLSKNGRYTF